MAATNLRLLGLARKNVVLSSLRCFHLEAWASPRKVSVAALFVFFSALLSAKFSTYDGSADQSGAKQISPAQVQSDIEKLVSFQTRSTFPHRMQLPSRPGAASGAREWIKSQFERSSQECAGCLRVKTDTFTQQTGERIPSPTVLTNVYTQC
jgi:hypothetical protein